MTALQHLLQILIEPRSKTGFRIFEAFVLFVLLYSGILEL